VVNNRHCTRYRSRAARAIGGSATVLLTKYEVSGNGIALALVLSESPWLGRKCT
jgi:hypothetical protein